MREQARLERVKYVVTHFGPKKKKYGKEKKKKKKPDPYFNFQHIFIFNLYFIRAFILFTH